MECLQNDFVETNGIKRIIQAMHAHIWPQMTMKDKNHTYRPSEKFQQLLREEIRSSLPQTPAPETAAADGSGNSEPSDSQRLAGLTLENIESFENLFGNLADMKGESKI